MNRAEIEDRLSRARTSLRAAEEAGAMIRPHAVSKLADIIEALLPLAYVEGEETWRERCWKAEANDEVSREFMKVSDERWKAAAAELEEARRALEPFARYADRLAPETINYVPDGCPVMASPTSVPLGERLTVADLRRARAILQKPPLGHTEE